MPKCKSAHAKDHNAKIRRKKKSKNILTGC